MDITLHIIYGQPRLRYYESGVPRQLSTLHQSGIVNSGLKCAIPIQITYQVMCQVFPLVWRRNTQDSTRAKLTQDNHFSYLDGSSVLIFF